MPDLVGNPEDRFSHDAAQIVTYPVSVSNDVGFQLILILFEPRCEKTGLRGFRTGPTQTGLCSLRR